MNKPDDTAPVCWIIAGPNGAGKTSFALDYLPEVAECRHFVNADLIAAGLSPLHPEEEQLAASRLYLTEIERCIDAGEDFAFETTLSGRAYLRLVARLLRAGWRVELIYLALPDVEMSLQRVAERVAHGGHNIPQAAIERRFPSSLYNLFTEYAAKANRTQCFLNSGDTPSPVFFRHTNELDILDGPVYRHLRKEAGL